MKKIYQQITPETWCQGKTRIGPAYCALGWIYKVYGGNENSYVKQLTFKRVIGARNIPSVAFWNDKEGRTFAHVLCAFKEADL